MGDGVFTKTQKAILEGRSVDYRVIASSRSSRLRVRVGTSGVEVVKPHGRGFAEVEEFLSANGKWVVAELDRIEGVWGLAGLGLPPGHLLYRGEPTLVSLEENGHVTRSNRVVHEHGSIRVFVSGRAKTSPSKTLEKWFRGRARSAIGEVISEISGRIGVSPARVLIMDQRTKWGNCSGLGNLSFNWRLILAPEFVLRSLVVHEASHLLVADHSSRFWLLVQSIEPEAERARWWLADYGHELRVDLNLVLDPTKQHGSE